MTYDHTPELIATLERIATALEKPYPQPHHATPISIPTLGVYHADEDAFESVERLNAPDLALLGGIDHQKQILQENTQRFARGYPANNALLWGARGTGKSSLIKAIIVLIDDISFEKEDASYKSLKSLLDGGLAARPEHVLLYATSNRRHLMPREMSENDALAIHAHETTDEKVSLSDRFGLWLGFHPMDQLTYLQIMEAYRDAYALPYDNETLHREAIAWAAGRGARSGRVAWQCVLDLAGRAGITL